MTTLLSVSLSVNICVFIYLKDFEKSSMRREARNFTTLKVTLLIAGIIFLELSIVKC